MKKRKLAILLMALLCGLVLAIGVQAQLSTNYDLGWHVIGNGGRGMGSASYAMTGTLGQPLAGQVESTSYTLSQGYWVPGSPVVHRIHLPMVIRSEA